MFVPDQTIWVKNKDGYFTAGTVLSELDFGDSPSYWVKFMYSGIEETSVFELEELLGWNGGPAAECQCGSDKLKISDRHSHWCPKFNPHG